MAESMKGKVALISGAASGFAKATAEVFANEGACDLLLMDINADGLAATVKECEKGGVKVISMLGDVTKSSTFEKALEIIEAEWGKLDFLINYAGGAVRLADVEEQDDATIEKTFALNTYSAMYSCRTFTPMMKKQGYGKMINVSSVCDRRSWPGWNIYSAAKAAVNAFSKCLYTELRPHGVGVTLIVPGGSNTGFQSGDNGVDKFEWDEDYAVRPEHFADMVYQICSLTKGGVASELCLYGLAQDISGF